MTELRQRLRCEQTYVRALDAGLGPLAAGILAQRVSGFDGDMRPLVNPALKFISAPSTLPDVQPAVMRLVRALQAGETIGIVTDYDVDGITAHTLLRDALVDRFGHAPDAVRSYIGHRLKDGYGLSDNVCSRILAEASPPTVVITADCGTSDGARIARLAAAGVDVIVTDHHGVPDDGVPAAAIATVNPARSDGHYPDPAIAGCMVAWLLMAHLRSALIDAGFLGPDTPKLGDALDLVALGTVADAVSLFSPANRAVVCAGLGVLNSRRRPCWRAMDALLQNQGRPYTAEDLGFQIGPRINARGRLADPFAALRFLQASNTEEAAGYLAMLDRDNQDRRDMEREMLAAAARVADTGLRPADQVLCVFDESFHPGVQGIVASRLVERFGRVTAVLSPSREEGEVSGSLRSVDGVDVSEALRAVARADAGIMKKFGGHPKAAGVTLRRTDVDRFRAALADAVGAQLGTATLGPVLWHDGALPATQITSATLRELDQLDPFGRGFEPPLFCGEFTVQTLRVVGSEPVHLSMTLVSQAQSCRAIWFRALGEPGAAVPLVEGDGVRCAYRLAPDTWRGGDAVQLVVAYAERVA